MIELENICRHCSEENPKVEITATNLLRGLYNVLMCPVFLIYALLQAGSPAPSLPEDFPRFFLRLNRRCGACGRPMRKEDFEHPARHVR